MASQLEPERTLSLNDPDILRQVNELRQTDNVTSWFYLSREYLFLGLVLGGTIAFYEYLEGALSLFPSSAWERGLWAAPVTLLAIVLIGAGQQRLATLTHEA